MARFAYTLLLAICLTAGAFAQPEIAGVRTYGSGELLDVYATQDGGYAACGFRSDGAIIVRAGSNLGDQWVRGYNVKRFNSIVELDDHGFLTGGQSPTGLFCAQRTDERGNVRWVRGYAPGECKAVLELKNGNFVLIGWKNEAPYGHVRMINSDGNTLWARSYVPMDHSFSDLTTGVETEGGIIVGGECFDELVNDLPFQPAATATKITFDGEPRWFAPAMQLGTAEMMTTKIWNMVSDHRDGFLLAGSCILNRDGYSNPVVLSLTSDGEWAWSRKYNELNAKPARCQVTRSQTNGFALAGSVRVANIRYNGWVYKLTNGGEVSWSAAVGGVDNLFFSGVVYGHDNSIVACGNADPGNRMPKVAVLAQIQPEFNGPRIIYKSPADTLIYNLPGDSIRFTIWAINQWHRDMRYAWFKDDTLVATDTTTLIHFDHNGVSNLVARVYLGEDSVQVGWRIGTAPLHIISHIPDTLNLFARRGSAIDFSLDSIAVGMGVPVDYQWTRINLETNERVPAGNIRRDVRIRFPDSGHYRVIGKAFIDNAADSVIWNVRSRMSVLSLEEVSAPIDSGLSAQVQATIFNDGDSVLHWKAEAKTIGISGSEAWTVRQTIPVGQITRDEDIQGVIFDGESFFCAGRNGFADNMMYNLDRNGNLLGSFVQPGHSAHGFRDLEWDGELIWGSGEDTVYGINRDGEVIQKWLGPNNPTNHIAYDPSRGTLWLSGNTTNYIGYDRAGNNLGQSLPNRNLNTYGLGWFSGEEGNEGLYNLNFPVIRQVAQINKMNIVTGATEMVFDYPLGDATGLNGLFITRQYDRYRGWVVMTVTNASEGDGGDQIQIRQLRTNTEWLAVLPDTGRVLAGRNVDAEIIIQTQGDNGTWAFSAGAYEGEVVFTHDGQGGRDVVPIHLTVTVPNLVGPSTSDLPVTASLDAPYPNPFNARTTIRYTLPTDAKMRLVAYDVAGRFVKEIAAGRESAGEHHIVWDAAGQAAGVYFLRLETPTGVKTAKAVLVK